MAESPELKRIAWLEGRMEALEAALERRSLQLRALQRRLSLRDLVLLDRVESGRADLPITPFDPDLWDEDSHAQRADVEETLLALWSALAADAGRPRENP